MIYNINSDNLTLIIVQKNIIYLMDNLGNKRREYTVNWFCVLGFGFWVSGSEVRVLNVCYRKAFVIFHYLCSFSFFP